MQITPFEINLMDIVMGGVGTIAVIILLFIIFREFLTWYWKINKITKLLEEIRDSLKKETTEKQDRHQ